VRPPLESSPPDAITRDARRITGLERNQRTTADEAFRVTVTAVGAPSGPPSSDMCSSPYRPGAPLAINEVAVTLATASSEDTVVEVLVDGIGPALTVPAGATVATFPLDAPLLVQPTQTLRISSDDIADDEVGSITVALSGQSRAAYTHTMALGFPDAEVEPPVEDFVGTRIGRVDAIVVQPDGKILLGGQFTTVRGVARSRIARLNANGSLDTTFDPGTGANGTVARIALLADGKAIISGSFTTYDGVGRRNFARINADGSLDTAYDPLVADIGTGLRGGNGYALATQSDGKVVGISASYLDGGEYRRLFRLNADGTRDTTLDVTTSRFFVDGMYRVWTHDRVYVASIVPLSNDDWYVYNIGFTAITGPSRFDIPGRGEGDITDTAYDPSNRLWTALMRNFNNGGGLAITSFGPTATTVYLVNSNLRCVRTLANGQAYVGGARVDIAGVDYGSVALINSDGTVDTAFDANATIRKDGDGFQGILSELRQRFVRALVPLPSGKVLIGGNFDLAATSGDTLSRRNLVRLNADGSLDTTFPAV
jgi:uncharacterized delta-60 repeat protein